MKRTLFAFLTAVSLGAAGWGGFTSAQTSNEYQIAVALSSINQPVFSPGVPNLGAALKTLTAKADGVACTTETLAGATADVVLRLGLPGQPEACSVDGANVTLVDGNGHSLFVSFTLQKGKRDTLTNLAPVPPGSGDDPFAGVPQFKITFPLSGLQIRPPGGDNSTLGQILGSITAFADGAECGTLVTSSLSGDGIISLGLPGQPEPCLREGAEVTFRDSKGNLLVDTMVLHLGTQQTIRGFGIVFTSATPDGLTGPLRTSIVPPAAGDGGLLP